MLLRLVSLLCVSASALAAPSSQPSGCPSGGEGKQAPVVTVKNGSYVGVHNSYYNQDFFLGVPYAQPPINDLRFRIPQSLNESWSEPKQATAYVPFCPGYGSDDTGHEVSEDCLYLEVIRPSGVSQHAKLPVAVWIHGGGLFMGGSNDARYNLSFIVQNSVEQGTPMMAISIQYRLSAWGFLAGDEMLASGNTNIGFRDQRLALHWINENIAAFGGDKNKVTIWGESAGAQSVGAQLLAYNGRDDKLFRAAIAESGGPGIAWFPTLFVHTYNSSAYQTLYQTLVSNTSCASTLNTTTGSLPCLRTLPFSELNSALNTSTDGLGPFFPVIDHDFVHTYPSVQLHAGNFVHVPFLIGTNTDEGTSFGSGYGPNGTGVNTDAEFLDTLASTGIPADSPAAKEITALYPNNQSVGIPSLSTYPTLYTPSNPLSAFVGLQFRRLAAYFGDVVLIAPRRLTALSWAKFGVPCYTYRFDVLVNGIPPYIGATHFQEVSFVFNNTRGEGYAVDPFANETVGYLALAREMSGRWVGFVTGLKPDWNGKGEVSWPVYKVRGDGVGENIVFQTNGSSVEVDDWRKEGIDWINENALSVYGR
ncbi:carboxylesterase family protein [Rutstroemia sp. NJR-2017a BBW]|nr:carboxylesterase family protein [Rutstroemia sp. NJR-2017a BBW]